MAAPKPAAKKAKKPSTDVIKWEDQMREAAKSQVATETVGGQFKSINTKSGVLSIDDSPLKNNELRCVILMAVKENKWYEERYNPDVKSIPACYAFGAENEDTDDMKPHAEAKEPQHETCLGCPMNEFGSADTGRGKACSNIRRLAIVAEGDVTDAAALLEAEVRTLNVSVTSVKNWQKYAHRISEEMERPTWGVVTLLKLVPDAKTQFKLTFSFEELVNFDQDLMDAMVKRRGEVGKDMMLPYQEPVEEAKPQRKVAGKKHQPPARGKPAAARRGGKF